MPEGTLRKRLDRLENSLADLLTQVGQLREEQAKNPDPARADQINQLSEAITELKSDIASLKKGDDIDGQEKDSDPTGIHEYYFGPDRSTGEVKKETTTIEANPVGPSDGNP